MSKLTETIEAVAQMILREKNYLSDLDAKIGDGDHGINMARGFEAVLEALDTLEHPENPKAVLHAVGTAILENVGGAAGPLYGTGFLCASEVCAEDERLTIDSAERLLGAAIAGIEKRGHARRGKVYRSRDHVGPQACVRNKCQRPMGTHAIGRFT